MCDLNGFITGVARCRPDVRGLLSTRTGLVSAERSVLSGGHLTNMMQNGAKTLLLLIALSAAVFAQTPTGTLQGTIEDPSRAGIPNATVTITNAGTGETKEVKADSRSEERRVGKECRSRWSP